VSALAQTPQGRLTGRVLDPDGAAIPAAEVVAINEETGVATKARTNEAGIYVLPFLQPASYTITAAVQGFKKSERKGIIVETAQELSFDIRMELGSLAEVVQVTAASPLVENSTATVGQFLDSRAVGELPLGNRRAIELARLAGGMVWVSYEGLAKPAFSLAGGRVQNQMFWLDGGSIQNFRFGIGQVDTDPPVDVIREFRIIQNNYAAEYGGSAGGVIVSTTKSGTNQFHGSAYDYLQNERLNAPGFFAPTQGDRKLKTALRQNLFGGTLGGRIMRNRTHFFVGYEGTRRTEGVDQILTVPTPMQSQGDFSHTFNNQGRLIQIYDPGTTRVQDGRTVRDPFAGNLIPSARFDSVAKQLIDYWPQPSRAPTNVAGAQNFVGSKRARLYTRGNVTSRVDHIFSNANRFYFRFFHNRDPLIWSSNYPKAEGDPNAGPKDRRQESFLFADTHTFSPKLVLDARYTFGERKDNQVSAGSGSDVLQRIGLKGVPAGAFPAVRVAGIANLGDTADNIKYPIRQHQLVNNVMYVLGKHVMKFGGELRKSEISQIQRQIPGQYNFATTGTGLPGSSGSGFAYASFLLGFVNAFSLKDTEPLQRYNWYGAWFLQDDWKAAPGLTLNLGLRWETDTPVTDVNNRTNGFDPVAINPVSGTPGVLRFAGLNGFPRQPYATDWNNFGPRFGFAWQPWRFPRWVVRGGYGVFYENPNAHGAPAAAALGFDRSVALSSPDSGVTPAFYLGQGVPGVSLTSPIRDDSFGAVPVGKTVTTSVTFYETNRRTGYAQQFNFGLQRQFGSNVVVEASYLGNLGRKMPTANLSINQVPPAKLASGNAQVRRPFPQFNDVAILYPTLGVNNYHAGVLRVEKRLSGGFSLLGTYTWSRSIGNLDEAVGLGDDQIFQDYYNRKLDKGPSTIDIVHRLTWSSVYDLPFGTRRRWLAKGALSRLFGGWTVGMIASMQSGAPFTVTMQTDTSNAFSAGGLRANLVRAPNLPVSERGPDHWFDTDAFVAPPPYTFGNAGRGIIRADGRVKFDFSISKNFSIRERTRLQFRGELFNAFNHPDFDPPSHVMGSAGFGTITSATDPRTVQLSLRLIF
jgi:hypothetical protein